MSYALISPPVLRWARLRSHYDVDSLATKLTVKSDKVMEWESGDSKPTFTQAQKLANTLHIPFGYLFLQTPPTDILPLPDLRTMDDRFLDGYSVDLKEVIYDVLRKQDWYRDYRKELEYPELKFMGKYKINTDTDVVSDDITKSLKLTMDDRINARNWEEFFNLLIEKAEALGIWIMRSGKVGNNTHRILDVEEFRGFTIIDTLAPAIFINGADAKAAQIFTLVHELAHLWFGASGVSNIDFRKTKESIQNSYEQKCNEISAEVLVPKKIIVKFWDAKNSVAENVDKLSKYFRVSNIVVARRALDLGIIIPDDFFEFYYAQIDRWKKQKDERESGGSFYSNIPIAVGRKFSYDVLYSVYSQNLLMRDGARILGLNPTTLNRFAKEVGFK